MTKVLQTIGENHHAYLHKQYNEDFHQPVRSVAKDIAIVAGGLGIHSRAGQIGHTVANGWECDVYSELCCPGAKLRRWIPPIVTRFADTM